MRTFLIALSVSLPILGLGSELGDLGFRAAWREGSGVGITDFLDIRWSWGPVSLGAHLSFPIPGYGWSLSLRGTFSPEPVRLSLQGGLSPAGLSYLRGNMAFLPGAWELPQGELGARAQLDVYLGDPLGTPSLAATGSASLRIEWGDLWGEAAVSADLYPPPLASVKAVISWGYRPYPLWITVRNYFPGGWDYSITEMGYEDAPFRASTQVTLGPGGIQRAHLLFSFNPDPRRFSLSTGITPQGLSPLSISLGMVGKEGGVYLRGNIAFPLELRDAGFEVRFTF